MRHRKFCHKWPSKMMNDESIVILFLRNEECAGAYMAKDFKSK